jgi:phenylacetate-CoA ligase
MRRLQHLLEYAYQCVPYYRRTFDEVGFHPCDLAQDPASFCRIPLISKAEMRDRPEEFRSRDPRRRQNTSINATTGSTGEPFIFWEDHYFQNYANANTFRHHTWSGWQPGQPRAYYWGRPYKPAPREMARNFSWNLFFGNAFKPTQETMTHFADQIRKRKPRLLHGYTSAIYVFSEFVRDNGWDDIRVPAVFTTSEVLYPYQRKCIEETFGCRVFNRYASQEVAGIACECEAHDGLHISSETNYLEILDDDDRPVADGEPGNVVVTSLVNYAFPFIRYRHGDFARASRRRCPCGRGQPMLESVEGRRHDLFKSPAGYRTALWGIDRPFREMGGVRKFQVVQKSMDHILVRVIKDSPLTQAQKEDIERVVKHALGDFFTFEYEFPEDIPIAGSGKHRYTISEVD